MDEDSGEGNMGLTKKSQSNARCTEILFQIFADLITFAGTTSGRLAKQPWLATSTRLQLPFPGSCRENKDSV